MKLFSIAVPHLEHSTSKASTFCNIKKVSGNEHFLFDSVHILHTGNEHAFLYDGLVISPHPGFTILYAGSSQGWPTQSARF